MRRLRLPRIHERFTTAADRRAQVADLYREGYKQTEIADILGITQARVSQIMMGVERNRTNKRRMLRLMPAEQGASA